MLLKKKKKAKVMEVNLFPLYHCLTLKSWLGPAFCLVCDQEKVRIGVVL